jgi:hypothetical protein
MTGRVKLFRGEYSRIWERRLLAKGWPEPLAGELAAFLTGEGAMPTWPADLRDSAMWIADPTAGRRIVAP